jgi:hypothetical protein
VMNILVSLPPSKITVIPLPSVSGWSFPLVDDAPRDRLLSCFPEPKWTRSILKCQITCTQSGFCRKHNWRMGRFWKQNTVRDSPTDCFWVAIGPFIDQKSPFEGLVIDPRYFVLRLGHARVKSHEIDWATLNS